MRINYFLLFFLASFLLSCSSDDPTMQEEEMESIVEADIIGGWQLDRIRVEGADCQAIYGADVPMVYMADEEGCATPLEVLGNASRCVNVIFEANGVGTFLWSEITGGEDAPITYNIENGEVEYCFEEFSCSGSYNLIGGKLESTSELRLDQECSVIYVLRPK